VAKPSRPPCIYVLAGTNGAGKSSIGGAMILRAGAEYFNPDEATKRILAANPATTLEEANSAAWHEGRRLLERAIEEKLNFAFETTLGGNTIVALLKKALSVGIEVRTWYAGLNSPELHIARVRSRVARGGHDIPEAKIRERYSQSRLNLIRLLSRLTEVLVYDNSTDADPHTGIAPEPTLILHSIQGKIKNSCDPSLVPDWAKPIWMAAMKSIDAR
jgi:predicted ABC-type ATPase